MITAASAFPDQRPPATDRCFRSEAVEQMIDTVCGAIADRELAWLFRNCFPNTLDTTVMHVAADEDGLPDTFVITGDISAMWLRDSTAQVWPYLPLAAADPALAGLIAGVVHRQARCILLDPYANAFYRDPLLGLWRDDLTDMRPGVHERKWELDSPSYFLRLSHGYFQATGDLSVFNERWATAVRLVLETLKVEQRSPFEAEGSPYRFRRLCDFGDSLANGGAGNPSRSCGLVRSAFRPSDDECKFPFLVPANLMAAAALRDAAAVLRATERLGLAAEATHLADQMRAGVEARGVVHHAEQGEIWAYEVDGFGGIHLMDDANVPSLLSLPYLGICARGDERYRRTRAFCLSPSNPYFARGTLADGIGSPHTGAGTVWPIAIVMQALTAERDDEIADCLSALKATHAGTGFMHEAFDPNDPETFSRPWFAWANTLFGELIVTLFNERPHLLGAEFPSHRVSSHVATA